jgi:hypothetical protein
MSYHISEDIKTWIDTWYSYPKRNQDQNSSSFIVSSWTRESTRKIAINVTSSYCMELLLPSIRNNDGHSWMVLRARYGSVVGRCHLGKDCLPFSFGVLVIFILSAFSPWHLKTSSAVVVDEGTKACVWFVVPVWKFCRLFPKVPVFDLIYAQLCHTPQ